MKFVFSVVLTLVMAAAAVADPGRVVVRPRPQPQPQPVPRDHRDYDRDHRDRRPVPVPTRPRERMPLPTYPDAQGRVHRLALHLESLSAQAATTAQQLFDTGLYGDRLTNDEVNAVAQLVFVRDAALQFRAAVTAEGPYADDPIQSRRAYLWLNRAYALVEANPLLVSRVELNGPQGYLTQMNYTMRELRNFYTQAQRYGWSLGELIVLAEEMEQEVNYVYELASYELDQWDRDPRRERDHRRGRDRDHRRDHDQRERAFLNQLLRLRMSVQQFAGEARRFANRPRVRYELQNEFRRLSNDFRRADWRLDQMRYSPAVKMAFDQVEAVYVELELAFRDVR